MGPSDAVTGVFAERRRGHRPDPLGDVAVIDDTLPMEPLARERMNHRNPSLREAAPARLTFSQAHSSVKPQRYDDEVKLW